MQFHLPSYQIVDSGLEWPPGLWCSSKMKSNTNTKLLQHFWIVSKVPANMQTVQPFKYVKTGYFLMTNESRERWGCEPLGIWGYATPDNFDALKRYSCVLRGRVLSKIFAKLIVIFQHIFISVFSHTSTRFSCIFRAAYLRFLGISFS